MNLQFLATAGLGAALVSQAPQLPAITDFDQLSAHIPEIEQPTGPEPEHLPRQLSHGEYVPFATELEQPEYSAADLNSHILFRGATIDEGRTSLEALDSSEVNCMAENIYFEARGESLSSQMAVGLVTMNRLRDPNFPKTVCDVVQQGSLNGDPPMRDNCQFSWFCDGAPERIEDQEAWDRSVSVATRVLTGQVQDFTEGATYFHANYVQPRWSERLVQTLAVDNLTFYRKA